MSKEVGLFDFCPLLKYKGVSKILNKSIIFSIVSVLIFNSLLLFISLSFTLLVSSEFIFFRQF